MKRITLFGILIISLFSCTTVQERKPNILLIVSEDNGPDLGCYGNTMVTTPNLDNLASEGVRFTNAFVTYSVCSPSRGTIFTGLYPHQNGQIGLATHKYRMFEGIKTLPVYLHEAGYRSGCIGKIHVNPESDIPWDYRPGGILNGSNFGKKDMPAYSQKAKEFMNESDQPFFLMVNFPDAHYPFQRDVEGLPTKKINPEDIDSPLSCTAGADSEYLRLYTTNYYNCMNRLDESVGMLLDSLKATGKADNTVIIYLGDHGAQFSRGKCSNYEAALKVPFIMYWPDKTIPNLVKDELISSIDLMPTVFDIIGIDKPDILPGKSLVPFFQDKAAQWSEYIFADGAGCTPQMYFPRRSVRDSRFKLIHNLNYGEENPHYYLYAGRKGHFAAGTSLEEIKNLPPEMAQVYETWRKPPEYELYDLQQDPNEFENLSEKPEYKGELEKLKKVLDDWQVATDDPFHNPVKHHLFDEEIKDIKKRYKGTEYQKDTAFHWKYIDYFKDK
ncbi:MAG: sulfatase [Draconibacterium sp.]